MQLEPSGGRWVLPRPQYPGREDAVEQGLHQSGAEEGCAPFALEAYPQGLLQADRTELRAVVSPAASTRASPSRA